MAAKVKRIFTETDRQALLTAVEQCRNASIDALRRAPCTGDVYHRTAVLVDAIDGVAEVLTGDRHTSGSSPRRMCISNDDCDTSTFELDGQRRRLSSRLSYSLVKPVEGRRDSIEF